MRKDLVMRFMILVAASLVAVPAFAKEKPLPSGISMIAESDAKSCKFVDLTSASANFVFRKAEGATREALIEALERAKAKGANSAVMSGIVSANKETTVTLTGYSCPTQ